MVACLSCNKNITEETIVFEYTEASPISSDSIFSIAFPSNQVGYASTSSGIFKTQDRGENWELKLNKNGGDLTFFSENYGIHSSGMITTDGGETWTSLGNNIQATSINSKGETFILVRQNAYTGTLWKTEPLGTQLSFMIQTNTISIDGIQKLVCSDNYVYFVPYNFIYDDVYAFNTEDATNYFQITGDWTGNAEPEDLSVIDGQILLCGKQGSIYVGYEPDDQFTSVNRQYFNHNLDYYSIKSNNGLIVAVGDKTILTNKKLGISKSDDQFSEVLSTKLEGFTFKCYQIEIIDNENIAIIGENGIIYIGKI